jgi:di/tricarboxylate transporter
VEEDALSHLPWKMLFLLFGGGSLGEAIRSSELLILISNFFGDTFSDLHIYVQVCYIISTHLFGIVLFISVI